jgi:hypothetical protein
MPMDTTQPTRIFAFDLSGTSARYVGMGSVNGTIAGSWSMDEHGGVLRVAVRSGVPTAATSVVVLRPESGRLVVVGRLDGLGVGQELKSVRWFDDIAVLVTYRQTDPFYVVSLADPADPRVLGALHLPGWSSYLHPVGPHLVLGLGQTAPDEIRLAPPQPMPTVPGAPVTPKPPPSSVRPTPLPTGKGVATASPTPIGPPVWGPVVEKQRAKASLFDISDPAHPRDLDTVAYPVGSSPVAAYDPHAVSWLPDRGILLTVLSGTGGPWAEPLPEAASPDQPGGGAGRAVPPAWVSVLTVRGDGLSNRMVPVATTADVQEIRTVPLSDGRVVLVAGDSVSFLDL